MKPSRALALCCLVLLAAIIVLGAIAPRTGPAGPLAGGAFSQALYLLPFGSYLMSFFQHTERADFKGHVTDSSGKPIAGATVTLVIRQFSMPGMTVDPMPIISGMPAPKGNEPVTFAVTSDAQGYYELHVSGLLLSTNADLTCEAPGFMKESKGNNIMVGSTPPSPAQQDFLLQSASKLSGKVTNAATGAPVAGAVLRFGEPDFGFDTYEYSVFTAATGADGTYEIYLKPGCYGFAVTIDDKSLRATPRQRTPIKIEAGKPTVMNLPLQPTVTLQGTVQTADGAPLPANCKLNLRSWFSKKQNEEPYEMHTGPIDFMVTFESLGNGRYHYEIPGFIPDDTVELTLQLEGFALIPTGKLSLTASETRKTLDFQVSKGCALRGRVSYPDGTPAAMRTINLMCLDSSQNRSGTTSYLGCQTFETDDQGHFAIEHLSLGTYTITFATDKMNWNHPTKSTVAAGSIKLDGEHDVDNAEITLPVGQTTTEDAIPGTVLDVAGNPLPDCSVFQLALSNTFGAKDSPGDSDREVFVSRFQKTDSGGKFQFQLGNSSGNCFLLARHPVAGSGLSQKITFPIDGSEGPLEIRLTRGQKLAGHVVDTKGQLLGSAQVKLYQRALQLAPDSSSEAFRLLIENDDVAYATLSADDGSFVFKDVMPGEYHALVERSGFASLRTPAITVAVGQEPGEQTMVLGKGGCISCNLDVPLPANVSTSIHVEPRNRSFGLEPDPGATQLHECDMPADRFTAYITYTGPGESVTSIIQKFDLKMDEQRELDATPKPGSTTVSVKVSDFSGGEKVEVTPVDDKGDVIWGGEGNFTTGSGPLAADGTFTAYCIAPGNYLVTVDRGDEPGEGCQPLIPPAGMTRHLAERRITVKPNEPMAVECSVAPSPDRLP